MAALKDDEFPGASYTPRSNIKTPKAGAKPKAPRQRNRANESKRSAGYRANVMGITDGGSGSGGT